MNLNTSSGIKIDRLSLEACAEVADLLNANWPKLYGGSGCPVFTTEHLEWLYGGPDEERHLVLGYRHEGTLLAIKSSLYRQVSDGEKTYPAHLATHLTIDPSLDFPVRMALAARMSELHTIDAENELGCGVTGDLSIAFFEETKTLSRSMKRLSSERSIQSRQMVFRQAIVNIRKVQKLAQVVQDIVIRPSTKADLPALQGYLERSQTALHLKSSLPSLWHHLTQAPGASFLAAERGSKPVGFISTYMLDWIKDTTKTRNIVAELLVGDDPETLAILLSAAWQHHETENARGIVLDNTTYIDQKSAYLAGIMNLPKEMVLQVRSYSELPCMDSGFMIDVK